MFSPTNSLRNDVLTTIGVMAGNPDASEGEIVDFLRCLGYDDLQAEILVAFIPLGLGRAVIRRLPVETPIDLSDCVWVLKGDRQLEIPLRQVPEFVEALRLGEETFTTGIIPTEEFSQAVRFSVELNAISKVLNAGSTVANVAAPILLRLGDATGFEDWYKALKCPS
jgi:hypothetical protein